MQERDGHAPPAGDGADGAFNAREKWSEFRKLRINFQEAWRSLMRMRADHARPPAAELERDASAAAAAGAPRTAIANSPATRRRCLEAPMHELIAAGRVGDGAA